MKKEVELSFKGIQDLNEWLENNQKEIQEQDITILIGCVSGDRITLGGWGDAYDMVGIINRFIESGNKAFEETIE